MDDSEPDSQDANGIQKIIEVSPFTITFQVKDIKANGAGVEGVDVYVPAINYSCPMSLLMKGHSQEELISFEKETLYDGQFWGYVGSEVGITNIRPHGSKGWT